jgi:hypothetical protein
VSRDRSGGPTAGSCSLRADTARASAVFLAMTALFFWPVLCGRALSQTDALFFMAPFDEVRPAGLSAAGNRMLDDQTREFLPFFLVARDALSRGELPLWNPTIFAGTPLLADSQSAVLFPLNAGHYLLPPPWGFTVSGLAKTFLSALGAYLLGRRLRLSHAAALLAGTAYGFAAFGVFWLAHPHTNVTLLLPLVLLATEEIVWRPGPRAVAGLAMVVGAQLFGGHVEITFLSAVAAFLWLVVRSAQARVSVLARLRPLVGGYLLGAAVGALVLVPFLELLAQSITWEVRSSHNPFFVPPLALATLLVPDLFVLPGWAGGGHVLHALSLHVGVLTVLLALVAMISRPRRAALALALLAASGLVLGLGVWPIGELLVALPLFRQTPNYYAIVLCVLATCLLAGIGLDGLSSAGSRQPAAGRAFLVTLAAALGVGALLVCGALAGESWVVAGAAALGAEDPLAVGRGCTAGAWRALAWLGVGTIACSALSLRDVPWLRGAVIALVFAELWSSGAGWNPILPAAHVRPASPQALALPGGAAHPARVAAVGDVLPPNTGVYAGLHDIRGYDVPVLARFHRFFHRALGGRQTFWAYDLPEIAPGAIPFFDLVGVEWILARAEAGAAELPDLVVERSGAVQVLRNRGAFPRAFLVPRAEVAGDAEVALARVLALGDGLRDRVVLEGAVVPAQETPSVSPAPVLGADAGGPVAARITRYEPRRVEIEVDAPWPGWLVLTDVAYPGWRALVDGLEVPIATADALFRAVRIPAAGVHDVTFLYTPWSARLGVGLSLLGMGICAWLWTRER